jgi:hypothetical protein
MPKIDDQIATLQERLSQLKLRQQRMEARRRARDGARERKSEARRRFLVGGIVLEKMRSGEFDAALLRAWLDSALERKEERALFDLPPRAD